MKLPDKLADRFASPPRGMCTDQAAAYLSMSASTLVRLVDENEVPRSVRTGMATDRLELDAAFGDLKEEGGNTIHKLLGMKP
ncbi:hypothetical protein [Bradyrhizobium sp. STM 3843]|uniref:hypothetical protein n=1 Tax=Bradyrhizobium sp. STM 3843 TaxID=551947 RepID=UPI0011128C20|nr:hypothetical protein [Bradyrhizobium sp. STM 3843]